MENEACPLEQKSVENGGNEKKIVKLGGEGGIGGGWIGRSRLDRLCK